MCVETFAYFSEGQVCLNDQVYFCHPGEWITSYTEIEELTGIDLPIGEEMLAKVGTTAFCNPFGCRFLQTYCFGELRTVFESTP